MRRISKRVRCEYCRQWVDAQHECEHCGAPAPDLSDFVEWEFDVYCTTDTPVSSI